MLTIALMTKPEAVLFQSYGIHISSPHSNPVSIDHNGFPSSSWRLHKVHLSRSHTPLELRSLRHFRQVARKLRRSLWYLFSFYVFSRLPGLCLCSAVRSVLFCLVLSDLCLYRIARTISKTSCIGPVGPRAGFPPNVQWFPVLMCNWTPTSCRFFEFLRWDLGSGALCICMLWVLQIKKKKGATRSMMLHG